MKRNSREFKEHLKNIGFKKGYIPLSKGKKSIHYHICEYCRKEFIAKNNKPSYHQKFCSRKCVGFSQQGKPKKGNLGYKFPKGYLPWNKGLTKEIDGRLKKTEKHKENYRLSRLGEKNPMYGKKGSLSPTWQGGKSFEPYGEEFNTQLKNLIRKRDNQVCMLCGIHREKLKEALTVHHINYDKRCNLIQNLVSLCRKCHTLTNYNREPWISLFQKKLSILYGYRYSEDKKIILKLNKQENEL